MPLKKCSEDNKVGWKWGSSGKCYVGPNSKQDAIRQGIRIEGPDKFAQKAESEGFDISDTEIAFISDLLHEENYSLGSIVAIVSTLQSMCGFTEAITKDNFIIPTEADYIDCDEDTEDWDIANDYPSVLPYNEASAKFEYEHPNTGEKFYFARRGIYKKDGEFLRFIGEASAAERKVKLNKPFRTPDGPKKFSVYVRNNKGNVVKVNFGDPDMRIKKSDPKRRKSFRARHKCDTAKDKTTPRYWSCKQW